MNGSSPAPSSVRGSGQDTIFAASSAPGRRTSPCPLGGAVYQPHQFFLVIEPCFMLSAMIFGMIVAALKWPKILKYFGAKECSFRFLRPKLGKAGTERLKRRVLKATWTWRPRQPLAFIPRAPPAKPDIEVSWAWGPVTEDPEVDRFRPSEPGLGGPRKDGEVTCQG